MDNVNKNNVYSDTETMWHGKGRIGHDETCIQVFSQMDFIEFEKREFSINLNGETRGSGQFAIVRKSANGEKIIGTTKDRYTLVQPIDYCKIYDESVQKPVETLGFLGTDAEKMFITSKLPSISIFGDEIKLYQFLAVGFDGMFGCHQYVTKVRVVCNNTWNSAIASSETSQNEGRGTLYVGRHNQPNHIRDLRAWLSHVQTQAEQSVEITQNLFCKFESTLMTVDEAFGLTKRIYPDPKPIPAFFPDELRKEKQGSIDEKIEKQEESRNLVMGLFEGAGIQISKTAYGLFNSVTEAENHHRPAKKDTTYSILMGNRYQTMGLAMAEINGWVETQSK